MPSEQIANVLEKATHVLNKEWLAQEVRGSIAALEAEFFAADNAQIAKTRMLALDAGNRNKIGHFVLDLRQEVVVGFFCSPQTTTEFVQTCGDGYCIA